MDVLEEADAIRIIAERSFMLPATVDASNIKASYEHGVLTVTLPKAEQAKPRQIPVQATSK